MVLAGDDPRSSPSPSGHRGLAVAVLLCSSIDGQGLDELWRSIESHRLHLERTGQLQAKRTNRGERWMRTAFLDGIDRKIGADPALNSALENARHEVSGGRKSPTRAAQELVDVLLSVQRDRMDP